MSARRIDLDAKDWRSVLDFYEVLLPQIGAPDWHGRCVNALVDSMIYGGINSIEPPYTVVVRGLSTASNDIADEVWFVKHALERARVERRTTMGTDIDVTMEIASVAEIYVQLLDEGVTTYRPTEGVPLGGDRFLLLPTPNYDAADETWEFLPGSRVVCRMETKQGEDIWIARELCQT